MIKFTANRAECSFLKRHFMQNRPYADRISMGFLGRYLLAEQQYGESIEILSAIDQLEDLPSGCRTKKPRRFDGEKLDRFWHKHFSTSRHVMFNVFEYWGFPRGGNPKFDKLNNRIAKRYGDQPNDWPSRLTYELVYEGYKRRNAQCKATGDWIIYGKHLGQNYYLDLATHNESENPDTLYENLICGSEAEFPFLFSR